MLAKLLGNTRKHTESSFHYLAPQDHQKRYHQHLELHLEWKMEDSSRMRKVNRVSGVIDCLESDVVWPSWENGDCHPGPLISQKHGLSFIGACNYDPRRPLLRGIV